MTAAGRTLSNGHPPSLAQGRRQAPAGRHRAQRGRRADAMLDKGDLDGYGVWRRILRAVEEIQGTQPKPGEAVH